MTPAQSPKLGGIDGPHAGAHMLLSGNTEAPSTAIIFFHGRGASPEGVIEFTNGIDLPDDVLVCAPGAINHQWYPHRFLAERSLNEPHLSSALRVVDAAIRYVSEMYNLAPSDIVIAGFSQGACLVADFLFQKQTTYRGACIFSGGGIGSDAEVQSIQARSGLSRMPVYIECSEQDPHIPQERVLLTQKKCIDIDAAVTLRLITGATHHIYRDGVTALRHMVEA